MTSESKVLGLWRITGSEMWAADALDLVSPARLELGPRRLGQLVLIAIRADVDYRVSTQNGVEVVEFTWQGEDDGDEVCGRGKATIQGDQLSGRLFIHRGDESSFNAKRVNL